MRYCTATFLFLLFCVTNNHLHSQNLKEGITNYFHSISQYPQEKLYLHLDKPYYAAGERIYWKGYLIDAISHIPQTQSNFIYIELVDRSNEIVNKSKIKREKDNFHGSILLPADIPAGEYYLRAYTQWMMNAGEDYFYYHRLRIGNALDRSIQTSPAPEIYRKIGHQMTADMSGCYSGTLITYDYSGKYVVGQKPLSIEISITGDEADICWMEEDKEPVTLHGISNDSLLVFNKAVYCRSDHSRLYLGNLSVLHLLQKPKMERVCFMVICNSILRKPKRWKGPCILWPKRLRPLYHIKSQAKH